MSWRVLILSTSVAMLQRLIWPSSLPAMHPLYVSWILRGWNWPNILLFSNGQPMAHLVFGELSWVGGRLLSAKELLGQLYTSSIYNHLLHIIFKTKISLTQYQILFYASLFATLYIIIKLIQGCSMGGRLPQLDLHLKMIYIFLISNLKDVASSHYVALLQYQGWNPWPSPPQPLMEIWFL